MDLLVVILKLSRSGISTISTSSVHTKAIFDTKLYWIIIFLSFNKNHVHRNMWGFLGLTLTTDMPLSPTNQTGLYYWCSPNTYLGHPRPNTTKDSTNQTEQLKAPKFTHNKQAFYNLLKSLENSLCRIKWHNNIHLHSQNMTMINPPSSVCVLKMLILTHSQLTLPGDRR